MLHMLSCFDLKEGTTIDEFKTFKDSFQRHMRELNLLESTGPIGRRNKHPIMDTDEERGQEYFFVMSFLNEDQCNKAVERIYGQKKPDDKGHIALSSTVDNAIFVCWEDIE